jgi:hypothetical protein
MWIVSNLSVRPRTFSFESSGQGQHEDLSLVGDDTELANMLGYIDWSEDPAQVVVCDACGTIGCASGNYVALRRLDDFVVMAPPAKGYDALADLSARAQYVEPAFMRRGGVPLIPIAEWERLRAKGAPLPGSDGLAALRWSEAMLAAQIEAPLRLLGEPGRRPPSRLGARVAATDPWIDPETLDQLGELDVWAGISANSTARITREALPVSLILDEGQLREVVLFAKVGDGYGLRFEPGLVLQPSAE